MRIYLMCRNITYLFYFQNFLHCYDYNIFENDDLCLKMKLFEIKPSKVLRLAKPKLPIFFLDWYVKV